MSEQLSKRKFLKLMGGLSLGMLPFVGCYGKKDTKSNNASTSSSNTPPKDSNTKSENYAVTDTDIILLEKDNSAYHGYNIGFNKRLSSAPKYIAVVYTTLGVQYAIQLAKREQLPIAIKSGGHSFEGFSSNDGGMVINVSKMKSVTNNDDGTITLGAGLVLKELHDKVYKKGLLVPAGSCGTVGISGLALGGGYGFFSRKYGLTCDSITDATIVTADEQILQAADHPELLWALKGAGIGNFGVVTDITFKTHPMPATFSTYNVKHKVSSSAQFRELLSLWMRTAKALPPEAFAAYVQNGTTLTLLFTNYGNEDISSTVKLFHKNATSQSSKLDQPIMSRLPNYYGRAEPLYFKNASCGYYNGMEDIDGIADELYAKVTGTPGIIFQVNTLGGAINDNSYEQASAYPHRSYEYLGELQAYYDTPAQGKTRIPTFQAIQQLLTNHGIKDHYINYPDADFNHWESAYYGKHYTQLQALKKTWDPDNLFQYAQGIKA